MMRLGDSSALQWLFVLVPFVVIAILNQRLANGRLQKALGDRSLKFLASSVSVGRRKIKLVLQTLALGLMIVSLSRPQAGSSKEEIKSRGVELVVAIDVSTSMLAEDIKPNRLEVAKNQLEKLLDRLSGDKVGLVAFAGSALLISPLTTDYAAIKMFIESLSPDSVSTQGTVFKNVLSEAAGAFKRGGVEEDDTSKVARVLLIATDGEDQEPGAVKLARDLREKGYRVFTLGFGTRRGAPIPVRDDRGNLSGYKKDRQGQVVMSVSSDTALQELAAAGGGRYFHSSFDGVEIEKIKEEIDKLEKSEFDTQLATNYTESYQIVLLFALLVALLEWVLGDRRPAGRVWKGRFEVSES